MVVYDNITDPVELYKLSKLILTEIFLKPVLDSTSVYFTDIYFMNTSQYT